MWGNNGLGPWVFMPSCPPSSPFYAVPKRQHALPDMFQPWRQPWPYDHAMASWQWTSSCFVSGSSREEAQMGDTIGGLLVCCRCAFARMCMGMAQAEAAISGDPSFGLCTFWSCPSVSERVGNPRVSDGQDQPGPLGPALHPRWGWASLWKRANTVKPYRHTNLQ